ncbi:MAG: cardiolipin synthase [Alphaproteobacteria bacterium]|nr:cardiolipin synthase [Alphaproteobacteria bacterium]
MADIISTQAIVWTVVAVFTIVGILAAIHAVMNGRTAQGTIAWLLSLAFLPYISVPLYLIFGNHRFTGFVARRRLREAQALSIIGPLRSELPAIRASLPEQGAEDLRAMERLADLPFTRHNGARLLIDGQATYEAIFAGIEAAEHYVLVQFYIICDDGAGRALKDRLIARLRAGVRVYLLYDEIGCMQLPSAYLDELRAAGAEVSGFPGRRMRGRLFERFRLNFRNHRKIVVADGRVAWVGGHNIGDDYLGKNPALSPWRDTHVEIRGPAAIGCQIAFMEDWYWAKGETLQLNWQSTRAAVGDLAILAVPSGPADELETCALMFTQAIARARKRFWLVSPYFVPDTQVVSALQLAALRGVDVRILIPARADHLAVWLAGFAYLEPTKRAGVKIYRFEDGFLHQKVMLVDDELCAIGTANFDNRSFRINFEITMLFADRDFAAQVGRMLESDFERSSRFTQDQLLAKPFYFRIACRAARLLSPIL